MNTLPSIQPARMSVPRFGERFTTRLSQDEKVMAALGSSASSVASSGSAASTVASASGTAGSGSISGGSGLMSTGPQSFAAATILNVLNYFGLQSIAAWLVANPSVGGSTLISTGSKLGVPGAASAVTQVLTPR